MPFTHISLLRGHSPEYIKALSESLHQALVETFEVPSNDRFQAIHQHEPYELIFDPHYLGGLKPRSKHFVLFNIIAGKIRNHATKQRFCERLVERLATSPGLQKEDVMIIISTTQSDDWSFSNGHIFNIYPKIIENNRDTTHELTKRKIP